MLYLHVKDNRHRSVCKDLYKDDSEGSGKEVEELQKTSSAQWCIKESNNKEIISKYKEKMKSRYICEGIPGFSVVIELLGRVHDNMKGSEKDNRKEEHKR